MTTLSEDDDDKIHKKKKSVITNKKNKKTGAGLSSSFQLPKTIVFSAADTVHQPGAVEAGTLVIFLVVFLYFYGCYETYLNLPDVPAMPNFRAHLGENLNVAINDFDSPTSARTKQRKMKKKKKRNVTKKQIQRSTSGIQVPLHKWPVSIRDEVNDYETLLHSGDLKTKLSVPKFWSKPVHQNRLMSRETAMKIGSCIQPDSAGNFARGDACPLHQRTIFIAIASYRDFQCRDTVASAFSRAKYPDRLRVAVVDQIVEGEDPLCNEPKVPCEQDQSQMACLYKNQIDVYQMEASLSVGPVFARHIGYRLYRGEYYATQSDAHVTFTQDWDVDIISQMEETHDEMAVLSTYLTDIQGSIDAKGNSKRKTRPIMCNTRWEGGPQGLHLRHGSQPERFPSIHGQPQLSPWWAAGYSFSRGHFVVNVPYDYLQPMIFQGEEMSIGIRGFTIGYDYYAPERSVCFHHYATGANAKVRNKVHHFWENDQQYAGTGKKSMLRLLGIVKMNPEVDVKLWDHTDEDTYGLGGVRTPKQFYELYGIDVKKKTAEGNLCDFVDTNGLMHKQFKPFLRKDGMGIDYSHIHFKWTDPSKPVVKKADKENKEQEDAYGDDEEDEEEEEQEEEEEEDADLDGDEEEGEVKDSDDGGAEDPDLDDGDVAEK